MTSASWLINLPNTHIIVSCMDCILR